MTDLTERIAALIRTAGPISVAEYMALALGDPKHGYYATRDPIGAAGDFTTAPEISQMFGELIGIWCIAAFDAMGAPNRLSLVELGPGRGTLMADLMRTVRAVRPALAEAATIRLVETSPALRTRQAQRLAGIAEPVWNDRIQDLPGGPAIVIANEFFDALPARQFVKGPDGWRERVVGLDDAGRLAFGVGAARPAADMIPDGADAEPVGSVFEVNRPAEALVADIAARLVADGGALLAFDYGHARSGFGDTFQAVRSHAFADPLSAPGETDLTAHVDFAALARAAVAEGAAVHGPVTQGDFLLALGLLERAGRLGRDKGASERAAIVAAVDRLAGEDRMGRLFKAIAVTAPGLVPPGFQTDPEAGV